MKRPRGREGESMQTAPDDVTNAPPPPASLRARVLDHVARQASREPTPLPFRSRAARALVASVVWVSVFFLALRARANLGSVGPAVWLLPLVDGVVAASMVSLLVTARGRTLLGAAASTLLAALVLTPALLATVAVGGAWMEGAASADSFADSLRGSLPCGELALAVGAPLLALLLWVRRPLGLPSPWLTGATAGIAAASWGHAVLAWHCGSTDPWHLVVGHVLPALPLAVAGAALAARMTRSPPRRTPR